MNKIPQVYIITNNVNQKVYIGKANNLQERWGGHRSDALGKNSQRHIHRAMRKYGIDNFSIEPVAYYSSDKEALEAEIYWIAEIRRLYGVRNVYNETDGGDGMSGHKHSEESKRKMSKAMMGENNPRYGKTISEDNKKKLIQANKRPRSETHKNKLSESSKGNKNFLGKKHSEETKQLMSEAQRGEKSHRYGRPLSEESKKHMSEIWKGRTWKLIDGRRVWMDK